ncbi:hypothetical protein [Paludisphaera mucosa]|uniref:Uncharacterized protein n=1 Tax=Paludisphaera mucosa TaxID=3030827 RepID=A0ABT6FJF5_9BACT|nr:hypothetical protein [Paludisphaera mucosa]MDG3007483.1 hypothetical protein [Paludisphaera mucosa]
MCRYAWHRYRDHFACFVCRKAFKHRLWARTDGAGTAGSRWSYVARAVPCPDCGRPMVDVGLDFKAPPKADLRAWRILEILAGRGFTFDGCGCYVGYSPPHRLRQVPAWIADRPGANPGETLARTFAARAPRRRPPETKGHR